MPYVRYSSRHMSTEKKAAFFGMFLLTVLFVSLITAYTTAPVLVLGTERNTNGFVEYLCLGRGCEDVY